jgi:hypothetical protein
LTRRYRRSPHVLSYWTGAGAIVHNYATDLQAEATRLIWQLIDCCGRWRTAGEIRHAVAPRLEEKLVRALAESMVKATFLERSDRPRDPREASMDAWSAWNPAAGFFHCATRHGEYGDPGELEVRLHAKAKLAPMPASVKPPEEARLELPLPEDTDFSRVLYDRRTWRQFGRRVIEKTELATLLNLTSGITHWLSVPGLGQVPSDRNLRIRTKGAWRSRRALSVSA